MVIYFFCSWHWDETSYGECVGGSNNSSDTLWGCWNIQGTFVGVSPKRNDNGENNAEIFQHKLVGYEGNLSNCKEDHERGFTDFFGNADHSLALIASSCYDPFYCITLLSKSERIVFN